MGLGGINVGPVFLQDCRRAAVTCQISALIPELDELRWLQFWRQEAVVMLFGIRLRITSVSRINILPSPQERIIVASESHSSYPKIQY
jgi:hypothetical protein